MNMKKYMILAAVALVASAACTKVENDENAIPDHKIAFEVASFSSQTKAAGDAATSLNSEGYTSFFTYANYFPEVGAVQSYMNNVQVNYNSTTPAWAPARDYYWPKSGYINFYSVAGSEFPTVSFNGDKTVATAAYTDVEIESDDNFLVADAALIQKANSSTYNSISGVTGVPTLFRHQLARIKFTVKLATDDAHKSASHKFKVTILNASTNLSNLVVEKKGSLTLTNTVDATASAHTLGWTSANVWTPSATPVRETIDMLTPEMTLPVNTKEIEAVSLLDERTVMPQDLAAINVFKLSYRVEAYYGEAATPDFTEIFNYEAPIKDVAGITSWQKNQKITYNIIIDPVGEKILFDPAVEAWDESQTANITYPRN